MAVLEVPAAVEEKALNASRASAFEISTPFLQAIGWFTLIVALSFAVADVVIGPWDHDGGYYLLRASYVANGLRPYLDYNSIYPPLVDLIVAGLMRLVHDRVILTVVVPVLWLGAITLATAALVFACSKDRAVSIIVAAMFPLFAMQNGGTHLTLELGVALFGLLAFIAAAPGATITPARMMAAGAFATAAALSKQPGAMVFLPLAALLFIRHKELTRDHWFRFGAGVILPVLAVGAWLGFRFDAIYRNLFVALRNYGASSGDSGLKLTSGLTLNFTNVLLLACISGGVLLAILQPRVRWVAATASVAGVIEFLPRLARDYSHYNINIWPFAALVIALCVAQASAAWRAASRTAVSVIVVATVLLLFKHSWPVRSPLFTAFVPAARAIAMVTPENAVVRQYGAEPILEFLANRREEKIDKGPRIEVRWDGSGIYDSEPPPGATVVIVGRGGWQSDVEVGLKQRGYAVARRITENPGIAILRKREPL